MSQANQLVNWPAIIKLHGDDELIFVCDAVQFSSDDALQRTHFQLQDRLIDSNGAVFNINNGQTLGLARTNVQLSLNEVEALLRLHLSNNDSCCVSKFYAPSIREAIMNMSA